MNMTEGEKQLGDPRHIRRHLNTGGITYLNKINGVTAGSLSRSTEEISYFPLYLPIPRTILSIGVGQGEELHSLHQLYGSGVKIVGLDLSDLTLLQAGKRAAAQQFQADLVLGNASQLPFRKELLSGVVLSSLLHEIYSYNPNGHESWSQTIREAGRVLEESGCLFIRDFAALSSHNPASINFKTNLGLDFYEYFRGEFRAFNSWDPNYRRNFATQRAVDIEHLPAVDSSRTVTLSSRYSAEFIFHFYTFWKGYINNPTRRIDNINWKEINEAYFMPVKDNPSLAVSTEAYVANVLDTSNDEFEGSDFRLTYVGHGISTRVGMREIVEDNFDIIFLGSEPKDYKDVPLNEDPFMQKMELIFKKERQPAF